MDDFSKVDLISKFLTQMLRLSNSQLCKLSDEMTGQKIKNSGVELSALNIVLVNFAIASQEKIKKELAMEFAILLGINLRHITKFIYQLPTNKKIKERDLEKSLEEKYYQEKNVEMVKEATKYQNLKNKAYLHKSASQAIKTSRRKMSWCEEDFSQLKEQSDTYQGNDSDKKPLTRTTGCIDLPSFSRKSTTDESQTESGKTSILGGTEDSVCDFL